jgi:hypothetical protein
MSILKLSNKHLIYMYKKGSSAKQHHLTVNNTFKK